MTHRDQAFWLSGYAAMGAIVEGVIEHQWGWAAFIAVFAVAIAWIARTASSTREADHV